MSGAVISLLRVGRPQGLTRFGDTATKAVVLVGLVVGMLMTNVSGANAAQAPATGWSLQVETTPTNFATNRDEKCEEREGSVLACDRYVIIPTNIGSQASEGRIEVVDTLPVGLTTAAVPFGENFTGTLSWSCATETPSTQEIVKCTSEGEVPPGSAGAPLFIPVLTAPGLEGAASNRVEISGGGAPSARTIEDTNTIGGVDPAFAPLGYSMATLDRDGTPDIAADSHPGVFTTAFEFPSAFTSPHGSEVSSEPVENVKQIVTDLPVGVIGDAQAAGKCSLLSVTNLKGSLRQCPRSSRVGTLVLINSGLSETELTIFNVTPERGYAAEFAVYLPSFQHSVLLYAKLVGSGPNTHVRVVSAPQTDSIPMLGVSVAFFGDPSEVDGGATEALPFVTNPAECSAPGFQSTIYVDSWQHPGRVEADGEPDLSDPNWKSASSTMPPVTGCESLQFEPSLTLVPESAHQGADEPAGYESVLKLPQNEAVNGLATPPLKKTVVTLPAGVSISPSAAVGLVGCEFGSSGIGLQSEVEASQPGHCPEASKVGEVEATTPVLEEPLKGGVYVAEPSCGGSGQGECTEAAAEKGEVFAIYLELGNENLGVHVKLKGTIEVGGNGHLDGLSAGQVRATFAETPQDPVGELKLKFNGGPGAPLANPQTCGTFASVAELESWSHTPGPGENAGTPNVTVNSPFSISGCEDKFAPSFSAGTSVPRAGGYSPLTLTFSRRDPEQDLAGISVQLPAGLSGKIAGIPECGEAEANAGTCPASSRLGSATAGVGPGPAPLWQSGTIYFTGPYKGAPFGLSIVVPAKAGPYDLGNVVVRAALFVDPHTAQVTVISDPFPQSIDGVPLRLKTINTTIDRSGFVFNPTSCASMSITSTITSSEGTRAGVLSPFAAAGCRELEFKPKFATSTAAKTSKADGASLDVKLSYPLGSLGTQSNIKSVKVVLPKALPSRLSTLQKACTAKVFEANPASCPAESVVGHAIVHTPLLPVALEGPAYFVSHGGEAFPNLTLVLQGDGVTIDLVGDTDIKNGITSSTFASTPDVPFETFELLLPEGPHSALTTEYPGQTNLCKQKLVMPTAFIAQSGATVNQNTAIEVAGCPYALYVLSHSVKSNVASITVKVPGAGKLAVAGDGLTKRSQSVKGRQNVTVKLRLTTSERTLLAKHKGRRLRAKVTLSFSGTGHKKAKATTYVVIG